MKINNTKDQINRFIPLPVLSLKQIGLKSAKFLLTSTASLEYDRNRYIFYNRPVRKVIKHIFLFLYFEKA